MVWFKEPTMIFKYIWARYLWLRTLINFWLILGCVHYIQATDSLLLQILWLCPLFVIVAYLIYSWNIYFAMKRAAASMALTEDPIRSLYDLVAKFKYQPELEKGKIKIKTYIDCFNEKRGICWEQSAVLYTLYRLLGLPTRILWVSVDSEGQKVDHICLKVKIDGTWYFMDPTVSWGVVHKEVSEFWVLNIPIA